jgi:hypothetical protein
MRVFAILAALRAATNDGGSTFKCRDGRHPGLSGAQTYIEWRSDVQCSDLKKAGNTAPTVLPGEGKE